MAGGNLKDAASILKKVNDYTWDIPMDYKTGMRVPGRIFVSSQLLEALSMTHLPRYLMWQPFRDPEIFNGNARCPFWLWISHRRSCRFDRDTGIISPEEWDMISIAE